MLGRPAAGCSTQRPGCGEGVCMYPPTPTHQRRRGTRPSLMPWGAGRRAARKHTATHGSARVRTGFRMRCGEGPTSSWVRQRPRSDDMVGEEGSATPCVGSAIDISVCCALLRGDRRCVPGGRQAADPFKAPSVSPSTQLLLLAVPISVAPRGNDVPAAVRPADFSPASSHGGHAGRLREGRALNRR